MNAYVLWHIHELHDDYGPQDEEKLIGIYSTEEHPQWHQLKHIWISY